ncbi:ribonuclease P protein component [bacterium endosymbiont of Bathymodiolus sp. 5 South]|jgi:ribonuclease P protein component|uniref:ribonuclease P protein component n=1 Tax=bacterium endosymbiont of Bathymodiolus sp. 5 South TaxID=1181670 RepID=UPI0010B83C31|nr:ribonuclease P protein component [bacterium endosymbiont of Bathymodiolus sp. 5 South]CAC9655092.1 Ribonuclease P protein component (EC 3.1.26.5) [uncultured Gammaproteobacteria bacterium]SHN92042.1 Ribonuclease P protein component [bacterium endosymbiont of Bathymodiolus sp. 5 South]SSC08500.1 Ribonuclease P protein component [bacterium endosymbiont of Bathymodiolus sp. 5 South]VVH58700.1 Ribonuclease P protein component (EC [uncultured Gammaproteobacteria bacterium]VVH61621.1 Ribonuclease
MFFGLAREAKILKSSEYTHVFKGGTLARGKHWQVIAKPLKASKPRLGLAISKKVHRLAVDRNRFKRVARETFRLQQQHLDNWDFVVMARKSKPVKNPVLSAELLDLFKKVTKK